MSFIKHSLSQAIKWDGSSGGVIRMVIITKDGIERLIFYPDEYGLLKAVYGMRSVYSHLFIFFFYAN